MLVNVQDVSISLNKAEEGKNYDFHGSVYDHKEGKKVFKAFGKKKKWPSGDKYIHINFVPLLEDKKEDNPKKEEVEEKIEQVKVEEFNDDIPF
jgi:hypothetical protein